MARRILSLVISISLLFQQLGFAQVAAELNFGGYLNKMNSNLVIDKYRPMHLRYFSYDAQNDNIRVLLDKGDSKDAAGRQLQDTTKVLLDYFLTGLSLPNSTFWVNLRPDASDQIIDKDLENTDVGKIMLEADLQLKKDTALFTSPQTQEGKQYWDKLYKKAAEIYGMENVNIPTLTRPWIVPNEIIVREAQDSAYIYKATLKVMLEQDYLKDSAQYNFKDERAKVLNEYSSELIRQIIIPKLTKEVNASKRYAALRQVYYSLVLSRWFKIRFAGQNSNYAARIDKKDLSNLTSKDSWSKNTYFDAYKKSFSEGEYNIKEPVYTPTGQVIRSYFSGGIDVTKNVPINGLQGASPLRVDLPNTVPMEWMGGNGPAVITPGDEVRGSIPPAADDPQPARTAGSPIELPEIIKQEDEVITQEELQKVYWQVISGYAKEMVALREKVKDGSMSLAERERLLNDIHMKAVRELADILIAKHPQQKAHVENQVTELVNRIVNGSSQQHYASAMAAWNGEEMFFYQNGDFRVVGIPRDSGLLASAHNTLNLIIEGDVDAFLYYISGRNATFKDFYSEIRDAIKSIANTTDSREEFYLKFEQFIKDKMLNDKQFRDKIELIQGELKSLGIAGAEKVMFVDSGYCTFPPFLAVVTKMINPQIQIHGLVQETGIKQQILPALNIEQWRQEVREAIKNSYAAKYAVPSLSTSENTGFLKHPFKDPHSADGIMRAQAPGDQLEAFWLQLCFVRGAINYYDLIDGLVEDLQTQGVPPEAAQKLAHDAVRDVLDVVNVTDDATGVTIAAMPTYMQPAVEAPRAGEDFIVTVKQILEIIAGYLSKKEVQNFPEAFGKPLQEIKKMLEQIMEPGVSQAEKKEALEKIKVTLSEIHKQGLLIDATNQPAEGELAPAELATGMMNEIGNLVDKLSQIVEQPVEQKVTEGLSLMKSAAPGAAEVVKRIEDNLGVTLSPSTRDGLSGLVESKQKGVDEPVIVKHNEEVLAAAKKTEDDNGNNGPGGSTVKATVLNGIHKVKSIAQAFAEERFNAYLQTGGFWSKLMKRALSRFRAAPLRERFAAEYQKRLVSIINNWNSDTAGKELNDLITELENMLGDRSVAVGLLRNMESPEQFIDMLAAFADTIQENVYGQLTGKAATVTAVTGTQLEEIKQLFVEYIQNKVDDLTFTQRLLDIFGKNKDRDVLGSNLLQAARAMKVQWSNRDTAALTTNDIALSVDLSEGEDVAIKTPAIAGWWNNVITAMQRSRILGPLTSPFIISSGISMVGYGAVIFGIVKIVSLGLAGWPVAVPAIAAGLIITALRANTEVNQSKIQAELRDNMGLLGRSTQGRTYLDNKLEPTLARKLDVARTIEELQAVGTDKGKALALIGRILDYQELQEQEQQSKKSITLFKFSHETKSDEILRKELWGSVSKVMQNLALTNDEVAAARAQVKITRADVIDTKAYNSVKTKEIATKVVFALAVGGIVFGLTSFIIIPLAMKLIPATLLAGLSWFVPAPGASTTDTLLNFLATQKANILAKISSGTLARALSDAGVTDASNLISQLAPTPGTLNTSKLAEFINSPDVRIANAFRKFLEDTTFAQLEFKAATADLGTLLGQHYTALNNKVLLEQFLTSKGISAAQTQETVAYVFSGNAGGMDLAKLVELVDVSRMSNHAVADALKQYIGDVTLSQINVSGWQDQFIAALWQDQGFKDELLRLLGPARASEFKAYFEAQTGNISIKPPTVWHIVREYCLTHNIRKVNGVTNDLEKSLLEAIWNTAAVKRNLISIFGERLTNPADPQALARFMNYFTRHYKGYLNVDGRTFNLILQDVLGIYRDHGLTQTQKVEKILDLLLNDPRLGAAKNRSNALFSYLHARRGSSVWALAGEKTGLLREVFYQAVRTVSDVTNNTVTVNPFKAILRAGIAVVSDFWRGLGLWNQEKKQEENEGGAIQKGLPSLAQTMIQGINEAPTIEDVARIRDSAATLLKRDVADGLLTQEAADAILKAIDEAAENRKAMLMEEGLPALALTMIEGINEARTVEDVTKIRDSAEALLKRDVADGLLTQEAADAILKAIDEAAQKRKAELPGADEENAAKISTPRNWMKELNKLKANKEIKRIVNNMFTRNRTQEQILQAQTNALQLLHGNKGPAIASRPAIEEVIRAATLAAIEQAKARQAAKAAAQEARIAQSNLPATETGLRDVAIPENTPEVIKDLAQEMSSSSRPEDILAAYDLALEALDGEDGESLTAAEKTVIKDALRQIRAMREVNEINDWLNELLSYAPGSGRANDDVEQSKALIDGLIANSVLPDAKKEELLKNAETAYQNAVNPALSAEEKQVILQKSLLQEQARKVRAAIRGEIALVPQTSIQDIDVYVAAVAQKINDADLVQAAKDLLQNELKQMADKQFNVLYPLLGRLPEEQRRKVLDLLRVDPQASLEQFEAEARTDGAVIEQIDQGPTSASPMAKPDQAPGKKGGIDFAAGIDRTLVIKPMGSFNGLNFALPVLSREALDKMNLADEMMQIKNMADSGIVVSGQRIKEFMAACMQKGEVNTYLNDLVVALVEICQWQEANEPCDELPVEIKEALVLVDSKLAT
ncbi:MAG: hypothetical protein WC695_00220 [Candidatus Omnitrophota bacterium]